MNQHAPDLMELFVGFCLGSHGGEHALVLRDKPTPGVSVPVVELQWEAPAAGGRTWRGVHLVSLREISSGVPGIEREIGRRCGRQCLHDRMAKEGAEPAATS